MAETVRAPEGDIVTAVIEIDGKTMPDEFILQSLTTYHAVNRIPRATIVIADGDPVETTFAASESSHFKPGAEVEIKAGYHAKNKTIYKGVITRQSIRVTTAGSTLSLTCQDKVVAMTAAREQTEFHQMKDSDAMAALFKRFGVSASVSATTGTFERRALNASTPWDYILCRADVNGMIVTVKEGEAKVAPPDFSAPKLSAEYGDSILDLDIQMGADEQPEQIKTQAWDPKNQSVVTGASSEPSVNKQGNVSGKSLSDVLSLSDVALSAQPPLDAGALRTWANAALLKARLSRFTGALRFPGNADIWPGDLLELAGLGARFNGAGFVSAVEHVVEGGSWLTEVTLGLTADWFAETTRDASGPAAAARTPGVSGLQIATVKKVDQDPEKERRIQVTFPLNRDGAEGAWVRLASPYAANGVGFEFLPEIGDEVVIGFLDADPDAPIMLGALHSSARPSPVEPDDQNKIKAIVSRSKMKMSFDDVDTVLQLETPGGHVATFTDKDKKITLKDSSGNTLEMSESGVAITSIKDVTIKAPGKVSVTGDAGVTATSPADVEVSGMNTAVKADMGATVEGGMSAKLTSSGETGVSGTMVMIN